MFIKICKSLKKLYYSIRIIGEMYVFGSESDCFSVLNCWWKYYKKLLSFKFCSSDLFNVIYVYFIVVIGI